MTARLLVAWLGLTGRAAAQGCVFDTELLRDLPSGHDAWGLFETLEATTVLDRIAAGGLFTGETQRLGAHGASWTQASWRLGPVDITDPGSGGVPMLLVDPEWLESISASTALTGAEQGGSGPAVTLTPRRPGANWHGSVSGDLVPEALQSGRATQAPAVTRYTSSGSSRFRVDGPIVRERLGLLVAGTYARTRRLERDDPRTVAGREAGLLAHLVWTPRSSDDLRLLGAWQTTTHPYAGRARFGGGDIPQDDRFLQLQATWQRRGGRPWSLSAGLSRASFEPELHGRTAGATLERLRDAPTPTLFPGEATRSRVVLVADAQPLAGPRHVLRVGGFAGWSRDSTRPAGAPGLTPESVNGLAARVWDYGWPGPESRRRAFDLAAHAEDRFSHGRLTLDAGLRFELTDGAAEGSPTEVRWRALSPRLAGRLRLGEGDGLHFVAGYARYRHRLPLDLLAHGDPAAPQGVVHRWLDHDGDGAFAPGELGPVVERAGPGGGAATIDPALKPPHTDEAFVGLETRLGTWTARLVGLRRRERDLVASVDVGAPASAYTVSFVPDPGGDLLGPADDQLLPLYDRRPESFGLDRYVLTNPEDENALHEGLEVSLSGRAGQRWRFLFGGTAFRSSGPGGHRGFRADENDQGVIGERRADPNAATYSRGRLFFDRAFTLKLAALYRGPHDLRLALVARYLDGQPFSRLVVAPELRQGPEAVQAIPNGRSRFTYTLTVDARLEKGVSLGRARLAALLDVFNVLDLANEVEEHVVTGAAFRSVTAVQPPRALRLGLRLDF